MHMLHSYNTIYIAICSYSFVTRPEKIIMSVQKIVHFALSYVNLYYHNKVITPAEFNEQLRRILCTCRTKYMHSSATYNYSLFWVFFMSTYYCDACMPTCG